MKSGALHNTQSFIGKKLLHYLFSKITVGGLRVVYTTSGKTFFFGQPSSPIQGEIVIHDEHLVWDVITLSELGLGMGFVNELWESDSPYHLLLVLLLNEDKFRNVLLNGYRFDWKAFKTAREIKRKIKNNRLIEHCRKQIGLTYDIGNDFYHLMLGPTMMYSCAIWPNADASLDEAQHYKAKVIVDKLKIEANHRVLDIGCGWGTLCHYIREKTNARVKGIALSHNQIDECKQRYPHIEFEYKDYREERGQYDRIVSVGMMEHVGIENIPVFLEQVLQLLKPGGLCLIHYLQPYDNIFVDDHHQTHPSWGAVLMPNAKSPTHSELVKAVMNTGRLRILHTETFAIHYARTGKYWLENLKRNKEKILKKYPLKVYKSHEYAWHLGSAAMETGYCLLQVVLEKKALGSSYHDSVIDIVRSRAEAL